MLGLIYGRPLNFLFEMIENLSADDRVPVTRDHFDGATTLDAGLDINLEYPFQVLGPDHGRVPLGGVLISLVSRPRRAVSPVGVSALLGENTPWKRVSLTRDLGTRAAKREMKSSRSIFSLSLITLKHMVLCRSYTGAILN